MIATNRRRVVVAAVAFLALAAGTTAVLTARSPGDGAGAPETGGGGTRGIPAGPAAEGTTAGSPGPGGTAGPVIMPGRPGEPARVTPGDQITPEPARYNSMDVRFVRMMIPHHTQALQMAALAPQRSGDAGVRALADRVRASQLPEIQLLQGWLAARHLTPDESPTGHDHETMPGMQSPAGMRRLTEARGAVFDRLFVDMMTAHHQGAVTMATEVLRVGVDTTVHQFATSVAIEQGVEVDRMRGLLR